jgi:hypothetical protein
MPVISVSMTTFNVASSFTVTPTSYPNNILGSDGLEIKDNVAYNTNGHCYFLEDGNEQSNVFDHNLGVNPRGVGNLIEDSQQIIPTDSSPSVFWITNPNNSFVSNAAVCVTSNYVKLNRR